ncbi:uncharacterized protein METZ01_LOCUS483383, partial [marine metagenome]
VRGTLRAVTTLPKGKVFPTSAGVNAEDHLTIGGCDALDLALEFGTPLYVFDEATLHGITDAFQRAFREQYAASEVVYACKAFINVPLARLLAAYGLGFDIVSGGEAAVLRAAGVSADRVYFHGNNKTPEELREAVDWG